LDKTVKLNGNGGTFTNPSGGTALTTYTVNGLKYGDTYDANGSLPVPDNFKKNNAFMGWYTALTGGVRITDNNKNWVSA